MRAGGCTLQRQALTAEAAAVVKQAINLARRRGHAQVTPLHVANTMLSSPTGLLRAACLQSHSHPLQCKALELCFNVALNRLPASTLSSPMLAPPHSHHHHHHHYPPSLSNALIAAFKRAQAHQRRGSIESQQQPLLAVKIELEQLVISILDDPSVSRVMREAGFSSTQVKSNVEQAVSMEVSASPTPPNRSPARLKDSAKTRSSALAYQARNEDVMAVLYALAARRKRSTVVVGETLAAAEAVVGGVMEKLNKGEVDPEVLRNVQFITLPLFSFRQMALEEVDHKVGELKSFVRSCCGGVVLYLKDLDWAAEFRASRGEKGRSYYCPLEHVIMEIRSLFCGGFEGAEDGSERIWLMAVATHQTYTRCRSGNPSLETLWQLEPLTIPDGGGLGLSLNCDSGLSQMRSKTSGGDAQFLSPTEDEIGSSHLSCCVDCNPVDLGSTDQTQSTNNTTSCGSHRSMSSNLPSWLQRYKEESSRANSNDNQGYLQLKDLCRRNHNNHPSEITFSFSSVSPSSSSISFSELYQNQQQPLIPHRFWVSETADECPEPKSTAAGAYPNSNPNASSASGAVEMGNFAPKFKELNAENLKTLCSSLEKRSTWQKDIIPEIASTVLQCRSGLMRRKHSSEKKEDTWLFFQGSDAQGKERIARELAKLVFGSYTDYLAIGLSSFSSTRSDSTEEGGGAGSKRSRSEASQSYMDRLYEAVRENPHRVIVMGDIEQVDCFTHAGIKRAIERGRLRSSGDEEVGIGDAIVILSCESFDSRSRACSPQVRQKSADSAKEKEDDEAEEEEGRVGISLDLNLCAEEEDLDTEDSFENEGLVESVDRAFFFNLPEDL